VESTDTQCGKRDFERQYLRWSVLVAPIFVIVTGAFLQKFILLADVPKRYIGVAYGLMSLVPPCLTFFLTASIERKGLRFRIFAFAYTFRFALVALLALAPAVLGAEQTMLMSLWYVFVMVLIALCFTFGNLCSESLVKEAIPQYRFGQFAAKVTAYSSLASIVPALACAFLADRVSGLRPLQMLLAAGGLVGAVITIPFIRGRDFSAGQRSQQLSLFTPLRDKVYMKFILFSVLQSFFVGGCSSFWSFFMIEELRLSLVAMVTIWCCCSFLAPAFIWVWGVVNDHFGPRPAFIYASFFTWAACVILVLPLPPLLCAALFCLLVGFYGTEGFFSCGRLLAGTALRNAMMPAEQSTTYIGLFQLASGVVGFLSGVAAGFALDALGPTSVCGLSSYRLLFLTGNVVFGCLTTIPLLFLRERFATAIDLKKLGFALINPTVFKDFYAIAMINSSETQSALEKTVKRLATSSTYVGRTELLRNFRSSSVRIRRQAVKGLGYMNDPEVLQALKEEVVTHHSPIASECIDALETLGVEQVIRDLFATYHGLPKEVRMRLVIAALNINSEVLQEDVARVLATENDLDIATEMILGLSGYGGWRIGVSALDRLQGKRLSSEQTTKLWMALGNIFSRRVKVLSLMSAEMKEVGVVFTKRNLIEDEQLLRTYLEGDHQRFHDLACPAIRRLWPRLFDCYDVVEDDRETVAFVIESILAHARDDKSRLPMQVVVIILHELNRFVADRGGKEAVLNHS